MALWSKAGKQPVSNLPEFDISPDGRRWTHLATNSAGREACGWVEITTPDYDPSTQMLVWVEGTSQQPGYYEVEALPANPPPPVYVPITITQKELMDLFTASEQIKIKVAQKTVEQMSVADFAAPTSLGFQLFSIAMDQFSRSKAIEVNNPQTIAAIKEVFVALGIVTPARANAVLAMTPPTV